MRVNVGIDVSKEFLDICLLQHQTKSGRKHRRFKNTKQAHAEVIDWLKRHSRPDAEATLITMESTGVYHESIALCLHSAGLQVFISNPGKAKKFSQSLGLTHKTDKSDAYMLAVYGEARGQHVHLWRPESLNLRNIKSLSRRLTALEKDRLRESNRLEACNISDSNERVTRSITRL